MRLEPFGMGERRGCGADGGQRFGAEFDEAGTLHEVEDRESAGKPRAASGGEHVIGTGYIVPNRFGRHPAHEYAAGVPDAVEERGRVVDGQLDVFGSQSIGERDRLIQAFDDDDDAVIDLTRVGER